MMLPPPPVSIHALPPPPTDEPAPRLRGEHRPLPEQLLRELGYDPATGRLWWLTSYYRRRAGSSAAHPSQGRLMINYMRKSYLAHRVIWTKVYGPIPKGLEVDHRDLDPMNNRLDNLRLATHGLNLANTGKGENLTSRYKGVSWDKKREKWYAYCNRNGKRKFLGRFDDEYKAHLAYVAAANRAFGKFARTAGTSLRVKPKKAA